jgi:hypothetical protein
MEAKAKEEAFTTDEVVFTLCCEALVDPKFSAENLWKALEVAGLGSIRAEAQAYLESEAAEDVDDGNDPEPDDG